MPYLSSEEVDSNIENKIEDLSWCETERFTPVFTSHAKPFSIGNHGRSYFHVAYVVYTVCISVIVWFRYQRAHAITLEIRKIIALGRRCSSTKSITVKLLFRLLEENRIARPTPYDHCDNNYPIKMFFSWVSGKMCFVVQKDSLFSNTAIPYF